MGYYIILRPITFRAANLYHLDPRKLRSAAGDCTLTSMAIRWVLDTLYAVKKSHKMSFSSLEKMWPFENNNSSFSDIDLGCAPEYLSITTDENGKCYVFSRLLKRYFDQVKLLEVMNQINKIDDTSIKSIKGLERTVEVTTDKQNVALKTYCGLIPTRSYDGNREVFCITDSFYSYLSKTYPKSDIQSDLQAIHEFFVKNPESRKHHASIKRYIEAWVSGALVAMHKLKKNKVRQSRDDFYKELLANDQ